MPVEIGKLTALGKLSVSDRCGDKNDAEEQGLTAGGATGERQSAQGVAGRDRQVDGTVASVGELALLLDVEGQSVD